MAAIKAPLGRRIPLVNLDHATTIPRRFVLKLPDQFSPTYVTDGLSQSVVLNHMLDLQTLDAYDLVFADGLSREFVLIVSSAIGNLLVDASNLQTSFGPVLRTFLFFCMTALRPRQLLFILSEELGIPVGLPIRGHHHRLQAQVQPHRLRDHFQ
jgi:hypothetical protein